MRAHQSTRREVGEVLGSATLISNIFREDCRNLLETLR
jgi:hypothetical protein